MEKHTFGAARVAVAVIGQGTWQLGIDTTDLGVRQTQRTGARVLGNVRGIGSLGDREQAFPPGRAQALPTG